MDKLEEEVINTIDSLSKLSMMTDNFQSEKVYFDGFAKKILNIIEINNLITNFKNVQDLKQQTYEKEIPVEVLDFIDKGESPDSFISNMIETIKKEGDLINGKEDLLEILKTKIKE
eukprot:gene1589-12714_t